jgi:hypothetical protein
MLVRNDRPLKKEGRTLFKEMRNLMPACLSASVDFIILARDRVRPEEFS